MLSGRCRDGVVYLAVPRLAGWKYFRRSIVQHRCSDIGGGRYARLASNLRYLFRQLATAPLVRCYIVVDLPDMVLVLLAQFCLRDRCGFIVAVYFASTRRVNTH